MKIKELINKLQQVDQEEDVKDIVNWLDASYITVKDHKTLSIADSGKALKTIQDVLGKPYAAANKDQSGHWLGYRNCVWGERTRTPAQTMQVCNALIAAEIKDYWITGAGWLSVRIPPDSQLRDFKTGGPVEWEALRSVRERLRLQDWELRRLERVRIQAESDAYLEAFRNRDPDVVEAEHQKHRDEQALQERIKLLGKQAVELEVMASQVQVTKATKSRIINLGTEVKDAEI